MEKNAKIFVAGHEGMVGAAIVRRLKEAGYFKITIARGLDLTGQKTVADFLGKERPEYVFLAVPRAGGILANSKYPAEFIYENIQGQANVIHSAWKCGVRKLLFLASSCVYPRDCPQPMKEEYLLTGRVEPTSEAYAIAKIAGIRMCQSYDAQYDANFISVVPADLYGPGDDFEPETAHVLASLIRKMHEARRQNRPEVVVWGTGSPRREALHVDDLADACIFLMDNYREPEIINVGSGEDRSIKELAYLMGDTVGFRGEITFDSSRPDGAPRKLLDISRVSQLGWTARIRPEDGIRQTYEWYKSKLKAKGE